MTWFGDPSENSFDTGLGTSLWLQKPCYTILKNQSTFYIPDPEGDPGACLQTLEVLC